MGEAIAYALLQQEDTELVTLAGNDLGQIGVVAARLDDDRLETGLFRCEDQTRWGWKIENHDVVIGAVSYRYNLALTRACIEAGKHFVDLGGNNEVVRKQLLLDGTAIDHGSKISPDNGIAPGAASVLVHLGLRLIDIDSEIDSVKIRVGGLDRAGPQGPLGYSQLFSIQGLINEYIEPTLVLRDGMPQTVDPMVGLETLDFPAPYGRLEAAFTSGGLSTLPDTLRGRVRNLDYKTLRYPGHWEKIRLLYELGFFEQNEWLTIPTKKAQFVMPREFTEALLNEKLHKTEDDALLLRITVEHGDKQVVLQLIDEADPATGHTAMQRTTGYSAAIVAMMLARDIITRTGVLKLEETVPPQRFVHAWDELGLHLDIQKNF